MFAVSHTAPVTVSTAPCPSKTAPRARKEPTTRSAPRRTPAGLAFASTKLSSAANTIVWVDAPLNAAVEPATVSPEPPNWRRSPPTTSDAPGNASVPESHSSAAPVASVLEIVTPIPLAARKAPNEFPPSW